ncbi:hypothetical protein E2C01_080695 [Portunus trituberculatus]|uniref:Uncharacterized protein n=1 Tax=Portunus trituberculatus TaxID=210409 RepID=A0A5B7IW27_PORTR|nr:hypothetical protein [Portunus trituberculatus]
MGHCWTGEIQIRDSLLLPRCSRGPSCV